MRMPHGWLQHAPHHLEKSQLGLRGGGILLTLSEGAPVFPLGLGLALCVLHVCR